MLLLDEILGMGRSNGVVDSRIRFSNSLRIELAKNAASNHKIRLFPGDGRLFEGSGPSCVPGSCFGILAAGHAFNR